MADLVQEFRNVLSSRGLACATEIVSDGKLHRFKAADDKQAASWYVLHQDNGFAAAAFGCWKRNFSDKWHSRSDKPFSEAENRAFKARLRDAENARAAAAREHAAEAIENTKDLIAGGFPAEDHPYLSKKKVASYGDLVQNGDELILPLRDKNGNLHSAQRISPDGGKRFMYGGRVDGCFFTVSNRKDGPLVICEGYATGASICEATGFATVAAMNCGNLLTVYTDLRALHPGRHFILAADNDRWTDGNPGLSKCKEIRDKSKDPNLAICCPIFSDIASCPTDFNDLACLEGLDRVRDHFRLCLARPLKALGLLQTPPAGDPNELIKHRWLCRHGFMLLTAPTGAGKSTLLMTLFAYWTNGLAAFGMEPTKCMKIVLIQAENDEGDVAEMRDGVIAGLGLTQAQTDRFLMNVVIYTSRGEQGPEFVQSVLRPCLEAESPDLICADPLLAYIGGDASSQTVVNTFLRQQIHPVLVQHGCAALFTHHISKPSRKDKDTPSDPLYSSFGSSEINNIFRAQLVMEKTSDRGLWRLTCTKREDRLRWHDDHGEPTGEKLLARSRVAGQLCWHETSQDSLPPEDQPSSQGRQKRDCWSILSASWNGDPTPQPELVSTIEISCSVKTRQALRIFQDLLSSGKIISCQPQTNPLSFRKS